MRERLDRDATLSIVVASASSVANLERCLGAILANDCQDVEVVVSHDAAGESIGRIRSKYEEVRFIESGENGTLPVMWANGIARSSGGIVAITDSWCVVASDWTTAIRNAHRDSAPVIGGAVEMAAGGKIVDWAAYFCEYGQFMCPVAEGAVRELPGNNISFKRWALDEHARFVEGEFWKTHLCRQLQAEGIELISTPAMRVHLSKSFRLLPFLGRRFHHGRCFAGMRIAASGRLRRLLYAIGTALLPAVFLARTSATVVAKRRRLGRFLLSLPVTILAILSWSAGETCGYLAGVGSSRGRIR